MTLFPVSLSLQNRKTLVVGTNPQALAIANELRAQEANVTQIGPAPKDERSRKNSRFSGKKRLNLVRFT